MNQEICRICMSSTVTLMDIFAKRQLPENEISLAEKIMACVPCDLQPNDDLPHKICIACILNAEVAYAFVQIAKKSNFMLNLHVKNNDAVENTAKSEASSPEQSPTESDPALKPTRRSLRRLMKEIKLKIRPNMISKSEWESKPKTIQCPHCPKAFRTRNDLKIHSLVHSGERPHGCPHCERRFARKGDLIAHIRTHTGERPYECPHCPKKFVQSTHMKQHIRTHTG
ncbi:hypothetical protein KR222_002618, partial [Zaprionus bogoriensis]